MTARSRLVGLVDEFVATMALHHLAVQRQVVEQEMVDRVAAIADRLQVTAEVVLTDHAQDGWGRQMAIGVIGELHRAGLLDTVNPVRLG